MQQPSIQTCSEHRPIYIHSSDSCMMCRVASLIIQVIPKGALTSGPGVTVFININNAVWLYTAICVLYAVGSCVIGEVARLPLVAGAADQRVP